MKKKKLELSASITASKSQRNQSTDSHCKPTEWLTHGVHTVTKDVQDRKDWHLYLSLCYILAAIAASFP